jgi:DNA-directed RNA polymerase subunit RPC12/RpoP
MTTFIYYCGSCNDTFEVEVQGDPPGAAPCPKCGYAEAIKAFRATTVTDSAACTPESGC